MDRLLDTISKSTIIPDEIVIFFSPVTTNMANDQINEVVDKYRGLNIQPLISKRKHLACDARHVITSYITQELVIYHDADDTSHVKRIEYIKKLFEEHDIVHLNHGYRFIDEPEIGVINYNNIQKIYSQELYDTYSHNKKVFNKYGSRCKTTLYGRKYFNVTLGAVSVKRSITKSFME